MDEQRLNEIRQRADAATPGPWRANHERNEDGDWCVADIVHDYTTDSGLVWPSQILGYVDLNDADAEFIVAPRAIDERVAWQLVSMMRDVVRRGTGTAARSIGRDDVGGKTGSTNDYRDAWFVGFGGNLVTTVWVGRDDNRSLGRREYGGRAALPIWIDYMGVALEGQPAMPHDLPDGMVEVSVSAGGRLLPPGSGGQTEYIKAEDLERMSAEVDDGFDDSMPAEEVFDIF